MKRGLTLTLGALAVGIGLPALVLWGKAPTQPAVQETVPPTTAITLPDAPAGSLDGGQSLTLLTEDGEVVTLTLDNYLTGVLLAEIPVSFEPEAAKAQAVVSRTYALRRVANSKHAQADICASPNCCQGWNDPATARPEDAAFARSAVEGTDGMVLTYGGSLIDATFFSCSGGRTEAAVAVWGSDVPYLQSVDSPGEDAPHNEDVEVFSVQDFAQKIQQAAPEAALSGSPESWFGNVTATQGDGVASLEIGGVSFTGTDLRSILGLRSTMFDLSVTEDEIRIETRGFGHRVGMSQYGADAMALSGSTWEEILLHYYTGVTIESFTPIRTAGLPLEKITEM